MWNPNESGRGFFIEMTGGVIYLAGYFYASDGRATWLSSGERSRSIRGDWPVGIPIDFSLGNNQTFLQNPRPYRPAAPATGLPPPSMKAASGLIMSDGSRSEWSWDCVAGI